MSADAPATLYRTFDFVVYGEAKSQGSKRAFWKAGMRHARVIEDNADAVKGWRTRVAQACGEQCADLLDGKLVDGPCRLVVTIYRPRPKSAKKSVRLPATRPDTIKLVRAIEDALTGVLYTDDSRIVEHHLYKKFGEPARCEISLEELAP